MAVRLLKNALEQHELTEKDAIAIMNYYLERNRIARKNARRVDRSR